MENLTRNFPLDHKEMIERLSLGLGVDIQRRHRLNLIKMMEVFIVMRGAREGPQNSATRVKRVGTRGTGSRRRLRRHRSTHKLGTVQRREAARPKSTVGN